nr:branched-chain amino acid ABC transporter permease [Lientehia hominis]
MKEKINLKTLGIMGALFLAACVFPALTKNNYLISVGVVLFTYAALGTAWNIIGGYAGQTCWCLASFMAIGAYTSFILKIHFNLSPWLGIFAGMIVSAALSMIIGLVSFKQRNMFFSLMTIAFSEIIRVVLVYGKGITGGSNGIFITYKKDSLWQLTLKSDKIFFYIMLAVLAVVITISWAVEQTRLGYYLRSIRADQDAAESLGINSYRAKLKSFVISAMAASAIGTFYGFFLTYLDPTTVSSLNVSTKIGTMAIVGGLGHLFGPLIGAAVLIPMTEVANAVLGSSGSGMLLYGAVLLAVIIFKPGGIISFFQKDGRMKKNGRKTERRRAHGSDS